jgi:hypothetical protein
MTLKAEKDDSRAVGILHDSFYATVYTSAAVHPSGAEMAAVRCTDVATYRTPLNSVFASQCTLIRVNLGTKEIGTIFAPPDGRIIGAPAWSPDGNSIALFHGRDLIVLAAHNAETTRRIPNYLDWAPSEFFRSDSHLAWDDAGARLYARHSSRGKAFLESIDVRTGEVRRLVSSSRLWVDDENSQDFHTLGAYAWTTDLPDTAETQDAVRVLFGSLRYPVHKPVWSPSRRYYFFVVQTNGFFSKTYVVRYDTLTGEQFHVRTIGRQFYWG